MTPKTLDDRREALENAFFEKKDEQLLERLRSQSERAAARAELAEITFVSDAKLLDQLIDAGIRAETWLALSLVPLVEVAWADRDMAPAEREAILRAAADNHIQPDSPARALLERWLAHRPPPKVVEAWHAYLDAVTPMLGDAARDALRDETLDRARRVAEAAGGFLGIGAVSEEEERVLTELARSI